LFAKEEFEPDTSNRFFFFFTGPAIAMTTALMTSADPFGIDFIFSARISYYRQLTLMLLYFTLLVMSIGVYGIMIGGWASNNKFH
jgi:NADH-quinone oxidoreductase subunit H